MRQTPSIDPELETWENCPGAGDGTDPHPKPVSGSRWQETKAGRRDAIGTVEVRVIPRASLISLVGEHDLSTRACSSTPSPVRRSGAGGRRPGRCSLPIRAILGASRRTRSASASRSCSRLPKIVTAPSPSRAFACIPVFETREEAFRSVARRAGAHRRIARLTGGLPDKPSPRGRSGGHGRARWRGRSPMSASDSSSRSRASPRRTSCSVSSARASPPTGEIESTLALADSRAQALPPPRGGALARGEPARGRRCIPRSGAGATRRAGRIARRSGAPTARRSSSSRGATSPARGPACSTAFRSTRSSA